MKFLPGTSLTRVMEGRELDEARSLLRCQQRNGRVRRREQESREVACGNKLAAYKSHASSLRDCVNGVLTPLIVVDSEGQKLEPEDDGESRKAVHSAGHASYSGCDIGPRVSFSMTSLVPESRHNISATHWDSLSEVLSVSSSMLIACPYDLDQTNLDWVLTRGPSPASPSPFPPILVCECLLVVPSLSDAMPLCTPSASECPEQQSLVCALVCPENRKFRKN